MKLFAVTLSKDEKNVLEQGLTPKVSTPMIDDEEYGNMLVLFENRTRLLLYTRSVVKQEYFVKGEYTIYEIPEMPSHLQERVIKAGYIASQMRIRFEDKELGYTEIIAIAPPKILGKYIKVLERIYIE